MWDKKRVVRSVGFRSAACGAMTQRINGPASFGRPTLTTRSCSPPPLPRARGPAPARPRPPCPHRRRPLPSAALGRVCSLIVPECRIGRSAAGGMGIGDEKRRSRVWGWPSFRKPAGGSLAGAWRGRIRRGRGAIGAVLLCLRDGGAQGGSGAGSCPTRSRRCGNRREGVW
jgi:hypothetical protein